MHRTLTAIGTLALVAGSAQATRLTFDIGKTPNGTDIPQAYGDRVDALINGDFSYGPEGGFTPNILASYTADFGSVDWWNTGYSDLQGVLYAEIDNGTGYEIGFNADESWLVTLESFDLGNFGAPVPVTVFVFGAEGQTLFQQLITLPGSASPATPFIFDEPLVDTALTIRIDTTGLGGSSDNVGIDNIVFGQTIIPSPGASSLLALAALAAIRRRR